MNKKKNNKGFTLVELIVVMAIMAILIGAIAPQVIKYVEKARESKDIQVEQTVLTAVHTAVSSSETTVANFSNKSLEDITTDNATLAAAIKELLSSDMQDDDGVTGKCQSAKGKAAGGLKISNTGGTITVQIGTLKAVSSN